MRSKIIRDLLPVVLGLAVAANVAMAAPMSWFEKPAQYWDTNKEDIWYVHKCHTATGYEEVYTAIYCVAGHIWSLGPG